MYTLDVYLRQGGAHALYIIFVIVPPEHDGLFESLYRQEINIWRDSHPCPANCIVGISPRTCPVPRL